VVDRYDAIVIGQGGMGSASVYHLARRGQHVLGLEQFDLLHELGSSHGLTRIIRLAYHEDPSYVPLLRRVYELWHDLETDAGERLVITTGSVEGGPEDGATFRGALHAAELHDLPHEALDADELRRRYPAYAGFDAATRVVLQADGGFLLAERTILAHVNGALAHSADLRFREAVNRGRWSATASGSRPGARRTRRIGWSSAPGRGRGRWFPRWRRWPCPNARSWPGSSRRVPSCSRRSASPSSWST